MQLHAPREHLDPIPGMNGSRPRLPTPRIQGRGRGRAEGAGPQCGEMGRSAARPPSPGVGRPGSACSAACGLGARSHCRRREPGRSPLALGCGAPRRSRARPPPPGVGAGAAAGEGPPVRHNRVIIWMADKILPEILWGGHFSVSQRWGLRGPGPPS